MVFSEGLNECRMKQYAKRYQRFIIKIELYLGKGRGKKKKRQISIHYCFGCRSLPPSFPDGTSLPPQKEAVEGGVSRLYTGCVLAQTPPTTTTSTTHPTPPPHSHSVSSTGGRGAGTHTHTLTSKRDTLRMSHLHSSHSTSTSPAPACVQYCIVFITHFVLCAIPMLTYIVAPLLFIQIVVTHAAHRPS